MANSVEPDQTAPLGAVWAGSALFALFAYVILPDTSVFKILGHLPKQYFSDEKLEMCQYDTDAPAQGHPHPQKMKLKKGPKLS